MDELEEMISENITLDSRVHARIIGARGKGIRKIMDEFKVRILILISGITQNIKLLDSSVRALCFLSFYYVITNSL